MAPIEQSNKCVVFFGIVSTLTHLLLGAVTFICCIYAFNVSSTTSLKQHVILCVIGYGLMMSQGIMSLNKHNGWSANLNFYSKNITHRLMGVIGAALAIAGSAIRIQGWPGDKFSTPHGRFGLIALILTSLTLIGGAISIYIEQKKLSRTVHSIAGCLTFTVAMMCLCLGLDKASFRDFISDATANTTIAFTSLATLGVIILTSVGILRRIRSL